MLIVGLICFLQTAKAQSIKQPCDTCLKTQALAKKQALDSSFSKQKEELLIKKDSLLSQQKQAAKDKTVALQNGLKSKTDSSARAHKKTQLINKGNNVLAEEKGKLNEYKAKANTLAKKPSTIFKTIPRKSIFSFTGEIRSENYATTAQNPMMRNEPMYSRLYIAPTISLLGLPFKATFFLTTENNNIYKSNFFTFKFDANAMRQKASADMQKQLDEAKKIDRLRQFDLQKNALETGRYQDELEQMKGNIPDIDNLQNTLKQQAEEKSKAFIAQQKAIAEQKLKTATEEEKLKIEQELKSQQDSIINHYKQQAGDSLLKAKGKYEGAVDTAKLGRYLRMQQQLENLKSKRQKIEDLRQMDSAKLLQKASTMRNPDDLRKLAKDQMSGNKLLQSALAVDRFGIGVVNPQYSEFTLFAASVKGLDIGINKDKYFYDITLGKTTKQFTGIFSTAKPVFDRNISVTRFGLGELKGNHLAIEYLYAFDSPELRISNKSNSTTNNSNNDNPNIPSIKNGVVNLSANFNLLKNTKVEANAAQSNYRESYTNQVITVNNNINQDNTLNTTANKAYQLKATQVINENAKIETQIKQTGIAFRTVGNPFLRKNFREFETKYEQQFWKKQFKFTGFYKEMRDNLTEVNKATNRLKGYGLKLSTNFEKYPNLSVNYSPYQQGNNHPDSIFRTNNQFSVTNAVLTYKKRYKTINWNGLASYTRSAMQLNDKATVAYKLISTTHTFQIGSRNMSMLTYLSNITAPFVDSLNSNSVQFSHTYLAKKNLSIGCLGEQTRYKNGASKSGFGLQATSTLFKNFSLSLTTRYDRIYRLWKLVNANVFTGRLVVAWRW